ncbi:MAG: ATP-dependent Clp protease proteolytic subunit [Smithella sp.]
MKEAYIRLMASVVPQTADQLFKIIDQKIAAKCEKIHLMLSSPGGSVFHGISIYNFLKGAPIEVDTYNFGSVDSIGVILFCAGKHRCSVPHARFLIHGVRFNFNGSASFDEKQLEEHLRSVKIDQTNIARIISDTTGKPLHKLEDDMNNRITLNPTDAKDYGLVHEIKSALFPIDADLSVIGEIMPHLPHGMPPFGITLQPAQAYTRSADMDIQT